MRFWKKVVLGMSVVGILLSNPVARATDIPIFPTGPVFKLTGLVWGTSTQPGFNNNYFFTPLNINESVCVYVKNNNPTNPHTFTGAIVITSDPSNTTPSDGTWQSGANTAGLFAATSPGLPAGIGVSISGVSQVSINLSASSTQAGSPDTANVTIVQTTGNCFAGNQFIGSAPQSIASITPLQVISDGLSQAFVTSSAVLNPAGAVPIIAIASNNNPRTIYLDRVVFTCTAVCSVAAQDITNAGTCATNTVSNQRLGSTVTTTATALVPVCTVNPTTGGNIYYQADEAANTQIVFDLRGLIIPPNTTRGIQFYALAGFTGTARAMFFWYEK